MDQDYSDVDDSNIIIISMSGAKAIESCLKSSSDFSHIIMKFHRGGLNIVRYNENRTKGLCINIERRYCYLYHYNYKIDGEDIDTCIFEVDKDRFTTILSSVLKAKILNLIISFEYVDGISIPTKFMFEIDGSSGGASIPFIISEIVTDTIEDFITDNHYDDMDSVIVSGNLFRETVGLMDKTKSTIINIFRKESGNIYIECEGQKKTSKGKKKNTDILLISTCQFYFESSLNKIRDFIGLLIPQQGESLYSLTVQGFIGMFKACNSVSSNTPVNIYFSEDRPLIISTSLNGLGKVDFMMIS